MLAAAVDWSNLTVAAAFVLGAVAATVATLRVVRAITDYFAGVERRRVGYRTGVSDPQNPNQPDPQPRPDDPDRPQEPDRPTRPQQ